MSNPRSEMSEAVSTSAMQAQMDETVLQLYQQLTDAEFDNDIFTKYHVKKYTLVNQKNELVDVWIYDQYSRHFPILEDQLTKRAESILAAAKSIFSDPQSGEQLFEKIPYLDALWREFLNILQTEFYSKSIDESKFKTQKEEGNKLIKRFINDITYLWKLSQTDFNEEKFREFHRQLWKAVETTNTSYKRNHILTINTDPLVQSVQYYERGDHPSAHHRSTAEVSNFIAYGTGYLDPQGKTHITDTGFRHASLSPIDLYKEEKREIEAIKSSMRGQAVLLNSDTIEDDTALLEGAISRSIDLMHRYYHFKTTGMTKETMSKLIEKEMQPRLPEEKQKQITTFHWVNVSLLTVTNDSEAQRRQYEETILAADLVRGEEAPDVMKRVAEAGKNAKTADTPLTADDMANLTRPRIDPIIFDLGVNYEALSAQRLGFEFQTYPPEQDFENNRAFFQLLELFTMQMKTALSQFPTVPPEFKKALQELTEISAKFKKEIEKLLSHCSILYAARFQAYQKDQSLKNQAALESAEKKLITQKKELHARAKEIIESYQEIFQSSINIAIGTMKSAIKSLIRQSEPGLRTVLNALNDFQFVNYLYLQLPQTGAWFNHDNNFKLQSRIVDLAQQLGKLEHYYPNVEAPSKTTHSWNCKSGNDRSNVMAFHVDQIRQQSQKQTQKDAVQKARVSHYVGSAFALHPTYDTNGGGPKFGGNIKAGIRFDVGHVDDAFADMQHSLSKLATHKMAGKLRKIPENFQLLDRAYQPSTVHQSSASKSGFFAHPVPQPGPPLQSAGEQSSPSLRKRSDSSGSKPE